MITQKSVPWWTEELTVKRKKLNSLRRLYQRTKNNQQLRERRKSRYYEEKTTYQATIKREKLKSWKEYCNLTPCADPWNSVYRLASNKTKRIQTMTTLQKPDGSLMSDLNETLMVMIDHLTPNDEQSDDTDHHKRIRTLSTEPIQTADGRNYNPTEVKNAMDDLNHKKAPGKDSITGEIYQSLQTIPFIYLHNIRVFEEKMFPEKVEKS